MFDIDLNPRYSDAEKDEAMQTILRMIFTKAYPRKGNLFRAIKTMELVVEQFTFGVEAAQVSTIVDYHDYYGGEVCWWLKDKIKKT